MYRGVLFDLDGVIVDTARYHFEAWKRLAISLGTDFTTEQNEQLKGVGRLESLRMILKWGDITKSKEEQAQLCLIKNGWYLNLITHMNKSEILPGVQEMLEKLKENNVHIALGSASKNAVTILREVGLLDYFEEIIDGTKTTRSKPDPQTFELGAKALKLDPSECVVIEDSIKGIKAARLGGFDTIGIGNPYTLAANLITVSDLTKLRYQCTDGELIILDL